MPDAVPPTVFLSYAWTDNDYQMRVKRLATDLRVNGVDVIFDLWDLEVGHDVNAFMERSVNDPAVSRVLILLNQRYTERADARAGGVGTETMILAPEIYQDPKQTRCLPIVFEQHQGQPYLPRFLRSRLYLDFSSEAAWAQSWPQLLDILHGRRPIKPPLGPPPEAQAKPARSSSLFSRPVPSAKRDSFEQIHQRLLEVFTWHGLDHLRASTLLRPFGFTPGALARPEQTLDLLTEEALSFITDTFQVDRAYLLGSNTLPGVEAGYWYKDVLPLCRHIAALHSEDGLEAVRFVTRRGAPWLKTQSGKYADTEEDVAVVLVRPRLAGTFEFTTFEVWETGSWGYPKSRLDLKVIILFCERLATKRPLLHVAGDTLPDRTFKAIYERETHIAQIASAGHWGTNWHPTDYVATEAHLAKDVLEQQQVRLRYHEYGLEALEALVPVREL